MSKIDELRLGFETAYIDGSVVSSNIYRPQFVSNNHKEGKKVLSSIEDELLVCDGFQISVAFITMNGITPLLQTLKELEKRNIKGEILTTNYLNFSEPKALKKLNELSNITLKMYDVEVANEGFHTKGYIFRKEEIYHIMEVPILQVQHLQIIANGTQSWFQQCTARRQKKLLLNLMNYGIQTMH